MKHRGDCGTCEELLAESVDGVISAAGRVRLDAHLAACEHCRREHEAAAAVAGRLRTLPSEELPPFFTARLLAQLEDERVPGLEPAHRSGPQRSLRLAWGSAAVLAIALVGTLIGYHAGWAPVRPHESPAPSLSQGTTAGTHENDARIAALRAGIQPVSPLDDAVVNAHEVAICAALDSSLPRASFRLLVDGRDVTALAEITPDFIIFAPEDEALSDGPHLVSVELDTGREHVEKSWIFYALDGKGREPLPEVRETRPAARGRGI